MLTLLANWFKTAVSTAYVLVIIACMLVVLGCSRQNAPQTNSATSHSQEIPLEVHMDPAEATEQYQRTGPR